MLVIHTDLTIHTPPVLGSEGELNDPYRYPILMRSTYCKYIESSTSARQGCCFSGRKVTEFLIKWHGYGDSHNSWEPRNNLTEDLKGSAQDPQGLLE